LAEDELFNLEFGYIIGHNTKQFGNSHYGSLIEHPQPKIDQAKYLYKILVNLDSSVEEKLKIPIDRWIKSKAEKNSVDKMIDLGIAFESIYLSDIDAKTELSFRLSLYASWYLGENAEHRSLLIEEFKAIYNYRSKAVHSGKLGKTVKVAGKSIPILTFIKTSQDLCRKSIIKILEEGEFPDWNNLILGEVDN